MKRPSTGTRLFPLALLTALGSAPLGGLISAQAATPNLVTNGTFTQFGTNGTSQALSFEFGTYDNTPSTTLTGWASTGYNFVFVSGDTYATGGEGKLYLWNSSNSGGTSSFNLTAPGGGNYVALDSDYPISGGTATQPMTQTINGLTVGKPYNVSFAWAGAQQYNFSGATTDSLTVNLGTGTAQTTQTISVANHGFSGWMNQTFTFIATSSTEVLSFLASGSPAVPPFVLLANVSVTAPEPASVVLLLSGVLGLAGAARTRGRRRLA